MSTLKIGVDLDLENNQIKNVRAENLASATPSISTVGRYFYNTTTNRLNYDNGTTIVEVANLTDVAGLLDYKGGYNSTTNVPNLTVGTGILKGDYYVVTVAGTFFGTALEIGDSLFSNKDTPIVLADWTLVQGNVVVATETVTGISKIATQALVNAGINDTDFLTPLKLKTATFLPKKFISASTTVGGGTPVTITHGLNNISPVVSVKLDSTGEIYYLTIGNFTTNTFDVTKNGANTNVTVTVIG